MQPSTAKLRKLSDEDYAATLAQPMSPASLESTDIPYAWDYIISMPGDAFEGYRFHSTTFEAFRTPDGHFEHVLVPTTGTAFYIAIVFDRFNQSVVGHYFTLRSRYETPVAST
jgi:hypothetical protein